MPKHIKCQGITDDRWQWYVWTHLYPDIPHHFTKDAHWYRFILLESCAKSSKSEINMITDKSRPFNFFGEIGGSRNHQTTIRCMDGKGLLQLNFSSCYKARHAHKRLYNVLPKYSKIQVLPGITSCRLMKYNKQAIELNSLLINNMPKDGYGWS